MRNNGGFHPPPLVPVDSLQRRRAIELLGNFTQKTMAKTSTTKELRALVGELPKSREVAQQWKAVLQKDNRRKEHKAKSSAFKNRRIVLERIRLPDQDRHVGRCFVLLGCLQRRYRLDQKPSLQTVNELESIMGAYPMDGEETHHFIEALVFLQKKRRSLELRPPRVPSDKMEQLSLANMLLGTYSVHGSIGRQENELYELLGALPRNRNVAASWKKKIAAVIRKKKRKEKAAIRMAEIEQKRRARRIRKQQRMLEHSIDLRTLEPAAVASSDNVAKSLHVKKENIERKGNASEPKIEGSSGLSFPSMRLLQGLLSRLFRN